MGHHMGTHTSHITHRTHLIMGTPRNHPYPMGNRTIYPHIHPSHLAPPIMARHLAPKITPNINAHGQWRIIVNEVQAHYETLTQTARIEECLHAGQPCPLVPECYETKCLQKFIYHRFLVYDPYDYYFPFAIESFKLPSACACFNG